MQSGFYMKFQCYDDWVTMPKIRLTEEKNVSRHPSYFLPDSGSVILAEKLTNNHFVKFSLNSTNENNTKIISIQPQFVLCNFSKYQLKFYAFCIHRNEKMSYNNVVRLLAENSKPMVLLNNDQSLDNT